LTYVLLAALGSKQANRQIIRRGEHTHTRARKPPNCRCFISPERHSSHHCFSVFAALAALVSAIASAAAACSIYRQCVEARTQTTKCTSTHTLAALAMSASSTVSGGSMRITCGSSVPTMSRCLCIVSCTHAHTTMHAHTHTPLAARRYERSSGERRFELRAAHQPDAAHLLQ
jgi:hypothetical protein